MALIIKDLPQQSGGWFKPADNIDAKAFLIEVTSFDRQRPTPNGPKDSALVDLTTFPDQESLDSLEPTVTKGVRIEQTVLARDLATLVGSATVVRLDKVKASKPGAYDAWVWRPVDTATRKAVVAYAEKREAEVQAALDDAPDFD